MLQFSQRQQGFVAYLTSTNNWPSKPYSDGVELTAGTGLGSQNGHYSGVLAVFNQGATKASFVDTDATCSMKKVYAYDKFGEYIGESPEACQQELSINVSATKHNALIYALEIDTVTSSTDAFTVGDFRATGVCADTQILRNPLTPCKMDCPANTFVTGCSGGSGRQSPGFCITCSPSQCPAGTFLAGCGDFGNGTCVADPVLADTDPAAIKYRPFLNYETKNAYTVTLEATDSTGNMLQFDVIVLIRDENDAPTFSLQTYNWSVSENAPVMTKVGSLFANDEDSEDALAFTLALNQKLPFLISSRGVSDKRSASIYTDGLLDYEQQSNFVLVAFVSDGKGGDASATISLNVIDADDVSIAALEVNTKDGKISSAGGDYVTIFGENFGQVCENCAWQAGDAILPPLNSNADGVFLPTQMEPNPFAFGNGAFTIDMWVRPTGTMASLKDQWIGGTQGSDTSGYFALVGPKTAASAWYCAAGGFKSGPPLLKVPGHPLVQNSWNHIACVRDAEGNVMAWTNGKNATSGRRIAQELGPGMLPRLGADPYENSTAFDYFRGAIRSVRFTRGIATYVETFWPSVIHSCESVSQSAPDISCYLSSKATAPALSGTKYEVTYGGTDAEAFTASDCVRLGKRNNILRCRTSEGYGESLRWKITISGASSGSVLTNLVTSYRRPVLTGIKSVNSASVRSNSLDRIVLNSRGGEHVIFYGTNVGLLGQNLTAEYGRDGLFYCAKCKVTVAHEEVTCTTVAGTGIDLAWRLVGRGPNSKNVWSSPVSTFSTDYTRPVISQGVFVLTASETLSTRGGDAIRLVGRGFGPRINARFATCAGQNGAGATVLDGSKPAPAGANDGIRLVYGESDLYVADQCQVLSDNVTSCITPAGTGASHAFKLTISGQESLASFFSASYHAPIITSVSGPGAFGGSTQGGMRILVEGDHFGPGRTGLGVQLAYGNLFSVVCTHLSQTNAECRSAEGFGSNFDYTITVDGQDSNTGAFNGSYGAPAINFVKKVDLLSSSDITADGNNAWLVATGGESIIIEGSNFGPNTPLNEIFATYSNDLAIFDAVTCRVHIPHTQITCQSAPGAGENHVWTVEVSGQLSRVPTVSYFPPEVHAVVRPLAVLSTVGDRILNVFPGNDTESTPKNLTTRGGEHVVIKGKNFGPPSRSSDFLKWVKYGLNGEQYTAVNCSVVSDTRISCLTVAGSGKDLSWRVNILGQSSALNTSPNALTTYAAPTLQEIRRSSLSQNDRGPCELSNQYQNGLTGSGISLNCSKVVFTDASVTDLTLRLIIRARHSGFGINDGTAVFVQFGNKRIPIDAARSTRRVDGYEDLAFVVPELSGNDASAQISVSIINVGASGSPHDTRTSNLLKWSYAMPIIQQVHLRGSTTSGQYELTVVGFNFGKSPGDVLLLSGDGDLDGDGVGGDGCPTCVISQGNPGLPSYVQSWTHREIQIRYMGSTGQIKVMSGGGTRGGSVLSKKRLSSNPISSTTPQARHSWI